MVQLLVDSYQTCPGVFVITLQAAPQHALLPIPQCFIHWYPLEVAYALTAEGTPTQLSAR